MAELKYYRNADGFYLGAADLPPQGGIECPPPADARQKWDDVANDWGAIPEEAVPLTELKPVDFMLGMLTLNVTPDQVDAHIDQLSEPDRMIAKIYWTRARRFVRDDPLIEEIATAFGKTSAEIDQAWRYAMTLSAAEPAAE